MVRVFFGIKQRAPRHGRSMVLALLLRPALLAPRADRQRVVTRRFSLATGLAGLRATIASSWRNDSSSSLYRRWGHSDVFDVVVRDLLWPQERGHRAPGWTIVSAHSDTFLVLWIARGWQCTRRVVFDPFPVCELSRENAEGRAELQGIWVCCKSPACGAAMSAKIKIRRSDSADAGPNSVMPKSFVPLLASKPHIALATLPKFSASLLKATLKSARALPSNTVSQAREIPELISSCKSSAHAPSSNMPCALSASRHGVESFDLGGTAPRQADGPNSNVANYLFRLGLNPYFLLFERRSCYIQ